MEAAYAPLSGITQITQPNVLALIDKVIEKVVRVEIYDGRIYIGLLMSCDQQRCLFIQDALELIDRDAEEYFDHDMFTPHLIKSENRKILKMMGSIVVPGQHVKRIMLDSKFQALFNQQRKRQL